MSIRRPNRKKIGRNDRCPCGSGKKYKYCHGSIAALDAARVEAASEISRLKGFQEAMHLQRTNQQGLGRPIISAEVKGTRFVAVRNRLLQSQKWKTFIDFLGDYIKTAIAIDDPGWGTNEIRNKALAERHPILQWYDKVCHLQRQHIKQPGQVYSSPITGAVAAYYGLAYDLYCLDHSAELQSKLIGRLRNRENFFGARYEIAIAAILIRAGFEIEFEDENKRGSTHCEFTATSRRTGRKFSVECKHRESEGGDHSLRLSKLGRTLRSALLKKANHDRIAFIDLNFPYDPKVNTEFPRQMELAMNHVRKFETNKANGGDLPPAFLFLTNHPIHHHVDDVNIGFAVMTDGFKIPEYKTDRPYPLREAIDNRERHKDIHYLLKSMEKYSRIPVTFDGEIPEFAFGEAQNRLLVGHHYLLKDSDGKDRVGLLTTATVNEAERKAYCGITLETGESGIWTWPLSDAELAAYKAYPETFFGEVNRNRNAKSPLELYDFFLDSYTHTPKEKILEFFAGRPNIEQLKALSQAELASMYAEHCVNFVLAQQQQAAQAKAAQVASNAEASRENQGKPKAPDGNDKAPDLG